jgi:hypothetical protein
VLKVYNAKMDHLDHGLPQTLPVTGKIHAGTTTDDFDIIVCILIFIRR